MDGAPIFSLYREALPAANLLSLHGVLNSTTNMILTRMENGESFDSGSRLLPEDWDCRNGSQRRYRRLGRISKSGSAGDGDDGNTLETCPGRTPGYPRHHPQMIADAKARENAISWFV